MGFFDGLRRSWTISRLFGVLSSQTAIPGRIASDRDLPAEKAVPLLRTWPFVRVWHTGCSTGEEVYSMAILLDEEGVLERSRIYATDVSFAVLRRAQAGIFPLAAMKEYTESYQRGGGTRTFSHYYTATADGVLLHPWLRRHVLFAHHDLAADASFNEFNVVPVPQRDDLFRRRAAGARAPPRLGQPGPLRRARPGSAGDDPSEPPRARLPRAGRGGAALSEDRVVEAGIVAIGTSLGGLRALSVLLSGLPAGFAPPLVIVQHRGAHGDELLAGALRTGSALPVHEVEDKDPIEPGNAYLAPADYHLLVDGSHFALCTEGPVCHARPSIDVLFESAAAALGEAVLAVVLTGTGEDGARGAAEVKRRGGTLVVEDPKTAPDFMA